MKKNGLVVLLSLVMGVLFVQADVLPEYDSAREKLVNIEMRANVADFPEWVFIQKLSRSHDDVVYFEVIDEEGILGCDRSQYIEELLAVPSLSFEERQQLMEYTTQMEAEINQYSELWNVCRETGRQIEKTGEQTQDALGITVIETVWVCSQQVQIDALEKSMKKNAQQFLTFLQGKGAIRLTAVNFGKEYWYELGCRENEVVKKSLKTEKTNKHGGEVKVNHLYITPEILAKGEKVESVEVAETVAVVESVAVEVAAEPNEIVKPEEEKSGGVDDGPNLVVTVAFPLLIVTAVVGSIVAIVTVRKKKQ